jgi:hypothetical protein
MEQLDAMVESYLRMKTTNALMITGHWGGGKTHYYKYAIEPKIKEIDTFSDASKKYKPIHISLFGLKSIDEIQTEIFIGLYPLLKNKTVKLGAGLGKVLMKGILLFKGIDGYNKYVNEGGGGKKSDWIRFEDLVICFDDLERISSKLEIKEFAGFVNSLVEWNNVKVIIIANTDKIDGYDDLKEKIVGNTIEFIPNNSIAFESIVKGEFSGFTLYKEFLLKNAQLIINAFGQNPFNLRTLIFFLRYFQGIFSCVEIEIVKEKLLIDKKDEVLRNSLFFGIGIAIEYKLGQISYKERKNLDYTMIRFSEISFENMSKNSSGNGKEPSYRETFLQKYFKDEAYYYTASIYNYLTGGSSFIWKDFLSEMKERYHIKENVISPQAQLLSSLEFNNVFKLSEKDYKTSIRELMKYSDLGLLDLRSYANVYWLVERFNNPLNIRMEKLPDRIIRGMNGGRKTFVADNNIDFYARDYDGSDPKYQGVKKISDRILTINQELLENKEINENLNLEELCYSDFALFARKISDHERKYLSYPLFKTFSSSKFLSFLKKSSNPMKWEVVRLFKLRYDNFPHPDLKGDLAFLIELEKKIERNRYGGKRGIKNFIYQEFLKQIKSAISRLSNFTTN